MTHSLNPEPDAPRASTGPMLTIPVINISIPSSAQKEPDADVPGDLPAAARLPTTPYISSPEYIDLTGDDDSGDDGGRIVESELENGEDQLEPPADEASLTAEGRPEVRMDEQQERIVKAIMGRKCVFFTGPAGTGKSVVIQNAVSRLGAEYGADEMAVLAPTGVAACAIGGCTLHRWGGIGVNHRTTADIVDAMRAVHRSGEAVARWKQVKVIIIDEISMVDGRFFDLLSLIGSTIKTPRSKFPKPFGGAQLVVTGDFFQLPPIADKLAIKVTRGGQTSVSASGRRSFAFEAEAWSIFDGHTYQLENIYRTKDLCKSLRIPDRPYLCRTGMLTWVRRNSKGYSKP